MIILIYLISGFFGAAVTFLERSSGLRTDAAHLNHMLTLYSPDIGLNETFTIVLNNLAGSRSIYDVTTSIFCFLAATATDYRFSMDCKMRPWKIYKKQGEVQVQGMNGREN
jgi:hypothetical protein